MKFGKDIDVIEQLRETIQTSSFIKSVQKINSGLFDASELRSLTTNEISQLKDQKNYSKDWEKIRVPQQFSADNIISSTFLGKTVIGNLTGSLIVDGFEHQCGIINSVLYDVQIGNSCFIGNVQTLSDVALESHNAILNCLSVTHGNKKNFGVGQELALAIESGGREIRIFPEINIDVARIICSSRNNKKLLGEYSELIDEYAKLVSSRWSILSKGAQILNSPKIKNVFLGEYAYIDNALNVENTVMISSKEEPCKITNGAFVSNCVAQWGCVITTGSVVENSIFTEYSYAKRQAMVFDSLIGANTSIAEGEVTSSLVGSFVGFHHQALLISAFWPEGKGNISYGANVGSNHTGKEPDQEIWPGEGTFMGLSVVIKFPADFTQGPYSMISSSVTTLPQKMAFPFSLINIPSHSFSHISPAYNEIKPAWVLSDNFFMIQRNELKYQERNKAKRIDIKYDIIRPSIVDKMIDARNRLTQIDEILEVYTDHEIEGLGKNYLLEKNRIKAIDAYSGTIQYYCFRELYRHVLMQIDLGVVGKLEDVDFKKGSLEWLHAKSLFASELQIKSLTVANVKECLESLIEMVQDIANQIMSAKKRDDVRGKKIIRDYEDSHSPAIDNKIVKSAFEDVERYRININRILNN